MHNKTILAAAMLVGLAACGDSTSPGTASGTVSFTFSGQSSGSYSASGGLTSTINFPSVTTAWAAAEVDQTSIFVAAAQPQASATFDFASITVDRATAGSSSINPNCSAAVCTDVTVIFGANSYDFFGPGFTYSRICTLASGTVTVSSVTSSRVAGTFSGAGACVSSGGATTNFIVSGGTFDTPRVASVPS